MALNVVTLTEPQRRTVLVLIKLKDAIAAMEYICRTFGEVRIQRMYSDGLYYADFRLADGSVEHDCDHRWVYQIGEGNVANGLRYLGLYDNTRELLSDVRVRPRSSTDVRRRNNRTKPAVVLQKCSETTPETVSK